MYKFLQSSGFIRPATLFPGPLILHTVFTILAVMIHTIKLNKFGHVNMIKTGHSLQRHNNLAYYLPVNMFENLAPTVIDICISYSLISGFTLQSSNHFFYPVQSHSGQQYFQQVAHYYSPQSVTQNK